MAHAITLQSPLGKTLRFVRMSAHEALGRPYAFALHGISRDVAIDLRALLGKPMAVKVTSPQGYVRHYHGIVAEAEQTGFEQIEGLRYATYAFSLVPKLWLLGQRRDCRIYKNKSVPELVRALLAEVGCTDVKLRLSASYTPREYCVQYRESALDFISRLMEQEGIYYYFAHSASTHTLVLADSLGAHESSAPFAQIPLLPARAEGQPDEGRDHRLVAGAQRAQHARAPGRLRLSQAQGLAAGGRDTGRVFGTGAGRAGCVRLSRRASRCRGRSSSRAGACRSAQRGAGAIPGLDRCLRFCRWAHCSSCATFRWPSTTRNTW